MQADGSPVRIQQSIVHGDLKRRCRYYIVITHLEVMIFMKTRLVRIGNSRGVVLPKPMIEETGLSDEVELRLHKGAIVVMPVREPRSGWAEAAKLLRERGQDYLPEPPTATLFDEEEWQW